jgi:serine/threonine protein kinase
VNPGDVIRDYVLEERIGAGGVGEVWRARHCKLEKPVAIKAIFRHLAGEPQFNERFLLEAISMARLEHPNIVGVHDFFDLEGSSFLVMSFVDGGSVYDRVKREGPYPVTQALKISRQILEALDFAHKQGVIHRDVKPSNILVDTRGNACLVDFGIALVLGRKRITKFGTNIGTPEYMSPEQIKAADIGYRTDVYSFGCVLYEMLTGRPPFGSQDDDKVTEFTLMEKHLKEQPVAVRNLNSEVDPQTEAVVMKALAKEPRDRFDSCREMAAALPSIDAGPTVVLPSKTRHKVWVALIFLFALTTAIASVGWFVGDPPTYRRVLQENNTLPPDLERLRSENEKLKESILRIGKLVEIKDEKLAQLRAKLEQQKRARP